MVLDASFAAVKNLLIDKTEKAAMGLLSRRLKLLNAYFCPHGEEEKQG
jgi:hypothetical protein